MSIKTRRTCGSEPAHFTVTQRWEAQEEEEKEEEEDEEDEEDREGGMRTQRLRSPLGGQLYNPMNINERFNYEVEFKENIEPLVHSNFTESAALFAPEVARVE